MWAKFTERARRIVFFAQEEAGRLGQKNVDTEHLLLGLMREGDCVAARILARLNVRPERLRADIEQRAMPVEVEKLSDMSLGASAKAAIDRAYNEARQLGDNWIGTEHILLGLIGEENGLAGQLLKTHGVAMEGAFTALAVVRATQGTEAASTEASAAASAASAARVAAQKDASVGDLGTVAPATGRDSAELARTPDAFQRLSDVFLARDAQGYRELLSSSEGYSQALVVLVPAGTPVKLLVTPRNADPQTARLGCYVRVLSGDFTGQTGFLRREAFQRTGADEAPFPPPLDSSDWITQG